MNKFGAFLKKVLIIICVIAMLATVVNFSVKYYQKVKLRELIAVVTNEDYTVGADVINQINIYLGEGKKIDTYEEHFLNAVRSNYKGEYDEAENSYLSAVECSDNDDEIALAYRMIGVMHCQNGNYKNAVEYLTKSLEYNPENNRGLLYLSESYLQQGNYEKALEYVNRYASGNNLTYSQIEAVVTMYISIKEYDGAVAQVDKAIEQFPDKKAELILFRLQANLMNGNYEEGIKDADKYVEYSGNGVDSEILVASYYYALGMYQEALDIYLVHIENEEYTLLEQAVECAYQVDDYTNMLALSKKALSVFEGDEATEYYKWQAIALMQLGNYALAIPSFNIYLEGNGNHYEVVYLRALCYFAVSNYRLALADFTSTIEAETLVEDSLYNRGLCYVQLNDIDRALADFKTIVDAASGSETYVNAVVLLQALLEEEQPSAA